MGWFCCRKAFRSCDWLRSDMYSDMNPCPDPDVGVDVAGAIEWNVPEIIKELRVCVRSQFRLPFQLFIFFFISARSQINLCGHSFLSL